LGMTKTELKKTVVKIKKLLKKRDCDIIDSGIELARALDEPAVFETLLEGCSIDKEGKIIRNKIFTGTGPAQPYLDHALLNLIGYNPNDTKTDKSLKCENIKKLNLSETKKQSWYRWKNEDVKAWESPKLAGVWPELPSGLTNLTNLTSLNLEYCRSIQNVNILTKLTNLTKLNLSFCFKLENVVGLKNCTKLTSLNLSDCFKLENVDGLKNCTKLTSLDISLSRRKSAFISSNGYLKVFSAPLQNVDGLVNLSNLASLNMSYCDKVQPKPSKEVMTTRKEVAAYQEEIRKSMK